MGVSYYQIFGQRVGSHHLAMATLGTLFGGSYLATRGGSPKTATATPPIIAASSDEFDFIKKFMEEADGDKKAAPAAKH